MSQSPQVKNVTAKSRVTLVYVTYFPFTSAAVFGMLERFRPVKVGQLAIAAHHNIPWMFTSAFAPM